MITEYIFITVSMLACLAIGFIFGRKYATMETQSTDAPTPQPPTRYRRDEAPTAFRVVSPLKRKNEKQLETDLSDTL